MVRALLVLVLFLAASGLCQAQCNPDCQCSAGGACSCTTCDQPHVAQVQLPSACQSGQCQVQGVSHPVRTILAVPARAVARVAVAPVRFVAKVVHARPLRSRLARGSACGRSCR